MHIRKLYNSLDEGPIPKDRLATLFDQIKHIQDLFFLEYYQHPDYRESLVLVDIDKREHVINNISFGNWKTMDLLIHKIFYDSDGKEQQLYVFRKTVKNVPALIQLIKKANKSDGYGML